MAHVELSVSESFAADAPPTEPTSSLEHWATAVSTATEPCLVVDSFSTIVAASPAACTLLGFENQDDAVGRLVLVERLVLPPGVRLDQRVAVHDHVRSGHLHHGYPRAEERRPAGRGDDGQ